MLIPKNIYPKWEKERDVVIQQIFDEWLTFHYPKLKEMVVDKNPFYQWTAIHYANTLVSKTITVAVPVNRVAECYEIYFHDYFSFQKQYDEDNKNDKSSRLYELLNSFKIFASNILSSDEEPITDNKRRAEESVHRILALFEEQKSIYFNTRAWLIVHLAQWKKLRQKAETENNFRKLSETILKEIQEKISSLPKKQKLKSILVFIDR